uniref:Secreted protein n=1 Tax=Bursaphelenchus xylophilus TaxID=6326 RepID=A0A1I7S8H0_BURXY
MCHDDTTLNCVNDVINGSIEKLGVETMASFIVLAVALLAVNVNAQCDTRSAIGSYLNCLKAELDAKYDPFEDELKSHRRGKNVHNNLCFDPVLSAIGQCDSQAIGAGCQNELKQHKAATCSCIDEARSDLKNRIAGIADAIQQAVDGGRGAPQIGGGSKVDACVNNIKHQLVTPTNDWGAVIDQALNSCIKNKPSAQSLGIDSLLNVGCRKIIADNTGTATAQLKTGFDFVNNLIDAMVDRSKRFCGGPHCGN